MSGIEEVIRRVRPRRNPAQHLSATRDCGGGEGVAPCYPNGDVTMKHVGCSPLTGTIFAGTVLKDGCTWGAGKQDVTIEALVAVAEHAAKFGSPVELSGPDGQLEYRITVEAF